LQVKGQLRWLDAHSDNVTINTTTTFDKRIQRLRREAPPPKRNEPVDNILMADAAELHDKVINHGGEPRIADDRELKGMALLVAAELYIPKRDDLVRAERVCYSGDRFQRLRRRLGLDGGRPPMRRPRDPALLKEMEDYIKTHQPPKK